VPCRRPVSTPFLPLLLLLLLLLLLPLLSLALMRYYVTYRRRSVSDVE